MNSGHSLVTPARHAVKPLLAALAGTPVWPPPVWLMRQAGRYLPEYRAIRAEAKDFLDLCFDPGRAAAVTLQPVCRFALDAAILFSDILVVPHAMGQTVTFREGEGPVLAALAARDVDRLDAVGVAARLAPVSETVRRVAAALPPEVALIGFAGAPWTVATYMIEGGSSRGFQRAKSWAFAEPERLTVLTDRLVAATVDYLSAQIAAGADVVQLFDSWAGVLPETAFRRFVIAPTQRIVAALKARHPDVPVIGFPRGAGFLYLDYARETGVDAVGVDPGVPLAVMRDALQPLRPVQGNLDPLLLVAGGAPMREAVVMLRDGLARGPHVFNLGHGIVPETPPEHVAELVAILRDPS